MACTKRCFSSVAALRRLSPEVLRDLLGLFPAYLAEWRLALPTGALGDDGLDYEAVRDALMAENVPTELDDLLYLSSLLGNPSGWDMIRSQALKDNVPLPAPAARLGYVDMAILAAIGDWPKHKDLLERANARSRVHSRSAYVYYAPIGDPRGLYCTPSESAKAEAREELAAYYVQQGLVEDSKHGRGTEIVIYDHAKEIWFLIRYPSKRRRHSGCNRNGDWQSYVYNPEAYDAVAYNKAFADLRMNTQRKRDHGKYRIVFGHLLFEGASNVFRPKADVVSLEPLKDANAVGLFNCDDIAGLDMIAPVEIVYEMGLLPTRRHSIAAMENATLLSNSPFGRRLVPAETLGVLKVLLRYRLKGTSREERLGLQMGNRVKYERDGDSLVIEDFLRRRGFVKSFVKGNDYDAVELDNACLAAGC